MKVYENENCGPLTLYVIFNEILIATVIFNEILIATEDNCVLHLHRLYTFSIASNWLLG